MFRSFNEKLNIVSIGMLKRVVRNGENAMLFYCTLTAVFLTVSLSLTDLTFAKTSKGNVLKSIAILPLENLTESSSAATLVTDKIKEKLKEKGWVLIVRDEVVEEFLYKRRLRYTGAITRLKAREMGKVLGVDAILIGSVEFYGKSGGDLVVGISARMVSTRDGSILWAENLSYVGEDFRVMFGLGVVKNLDKLSELVVIDLVDSIADNFFIKDTVMSPFEIEKFVTYPTIGKVGDKIELRVKFLTIIDDPKEVSVIINGEKLSLNMIDINTYSVFIDQPLSEGTHIVDIVAVDGESMPFSFDAVGKIVIDNTPPKINIIKDKEVISSLHGGKFVFETLITNGDAVDEWRAEIVSKEGEVVMKDRGFASLPQQLTWNGRSSENFKVSDGEYTLRILVSDVAGNSSVSKTSMYVKNTPPKVDIDVDVIEDKIFFSFNTKKEKAGDEIASWSLTLSDRRGNEIKKGTGVGEIPNKLEYIFDEDVEINKMVFTLTASDIVGNELKINKTLPSVLSNRMPFAGLQGGVELDASSGMVEDF